MSYLESRSCELDLDIGKKNLHMYICSLVEICLPRDKKSTCGNRDNLKLVMVSIVMNGLQRTACLAKGQ